MSILSLFYVYFITVLCLFYLTWNSEYIALIIRRKGTKIRKKNGLFIDLVKIGVKQENNQENGGLNFVNLGCKLSEYWLQLVAEQFSICVVTNICCMIVRSSGSLSFITVLCWIVNNTLCKNNIAPIWPSSYLPV